MITNEITNNLDPMADQLRANAFAPTDFFRRVHCVLGLPFDIVDLAQAEARLTDAITHRRRCFLSTPNLNFLIACLTDSAFRNSVIRSDLSVADGMPIVWIARLLGIPIHARVAGASLFEDLRRQRDLPIRVFFFGGPEGVAARASAVINAESGAMLSVGAYFPGFGSREQMSEEHVIAQINESGADLLVVALGAKRGQDWIEHNLPRLRVSVVSHLGAVVNFVAGTVSRAPRWVGSLGLEWLWRIEEEPTLWRRYWNDGITLLQLMLTRVFPAALYLRGESFDCAEPPQIKAIFDAGVCRVILGGAWRERDLQELREVFQGLNKTPRSLELNLQDVTYMDSATVALLLLVFGHQTKTQFAFRIVAISEALKRILRLNCAHFLFENRVS